MSLASAVAQLCCWSFANNIPLPKLFRLPLSRGTTTNESDELIQPHSNTTSKLNQIFVPQYIDPVPYMPYRRSCFFYEISAMWYFYILQSTVKPDWLYKGSTNDLDRRLEQHNEGLVVSTKPYRPLRLVYYEAYLKEYAARCRESSVKKSGSVLTPLLRRIKETLK